jgi:hypothetical protein
LHWAGALASVHLRVTVMNAPAPYDNFRLKKNFYNPGLSLHGSTFPCWVMHTLACPI